jgi:N6-L-threonylcarbamoyladenine synthase
MLHLKANIQKRTAICNCIHTRSWPYGSLLVGSSFKIIGLALNIPLRINHMQAHVLAYFIDEEGLKPSFPF